jgi:5'-deoxynucleotidase YfbR-like HD superfamily hydrolase
MRDARLSQQIAFLVEADKLKNILRRTPLVDSSRRENSAEHSWHLVLAAMVMREYVTEECDFLRALELMAVHDLVEIDAGDTFAYDAIGQTTKASRETAAAGRIFGLLPSGQASYFRALWEEFEAQQTSESRFANALDRFQPLLQNACSGGGSWRTHNLSRDQVLQRMAPVEVVLPNLWPAVLDIVDSFCASGLLRSVRDPVESD